MNQLYAQRSYQAAPTLWGTDATCEHWKMAFLFSFSLTGLSLLNAVGEASSALPPCLIYK